MLAELKNLYGARELLYMITYRDIKVRYKQSIMGFLWAILMPALIVFSGVAVRYVYAIAAHTPLKQSDIASVAVKSLPWAFVVSSIRFALTSLSNNRELVTKVYFPKEVFPLAAVLACLFDFFMASGALILLLLAIRTEWSLYILWAPMLMLAVMAMSAGIGMIASAASLFFRDVRYVVEVVLTFGIFFTPVFYDVRMLGKAGKWVLLNPLAPLLDALSNCITHQQSPDWIWLAYSMGFALAVLAFGYWFFKRVEPLFAETI